LKRAEGFPTTSIHGDRLPYQRANALDDFKSGRMSIIVATSAALRGFDVSGIKHVINYDLVQKLQEGYVVITNARLKSCSGKQVFLQLDYKSANR
jgi:superfamily II DNA/RNA helicase